MSSLALSIFAGVSDPCTVKLDRISSLPSGWNVQSAVSEKLNIALQDASDGKSRTIKIAPQKNSISLYGPSMNVSKGDTIEVNIKASGEGQYIIGYYAYGEENKYLFGKDMVTEIVKESAEVVKKTFEIEDGADFATKSIRVFIAVKAGSKVSVSSIIIDLKND